MHQRFPAICLGLFVTAPLIAGGCAATSPSDRAGRSAATSAKPAQFDAVVHVYGVT